MCTGIEAYPATTLRPRHGKIKEWGSERAEVPGPLRKDWVEPMNGPEPKPPWAPAGSVWQYCSLSTWLTWLAGLAPVGQQTVWETDGLIISVVGVIMVEGSTWYCKQGYLDVYYNALFMVQQYDSQTLKQTNQPTSLMGVLSKASDWMECSVSGSDCTS